MITITCILSYEHHGNQNMSGCAFRAVEPTTPAGVPELIGTILFITSVKIRVCNFCFSFFPAQVYGLIEIYGHSPYACV